MNFHAIIEARMSSKRLPGKVLLKIKNKFILDFLIDRLKKIKQITKIIVATTTNKKDKKIVSYCKLRGVNYFQGSEKNVLKRVYMAATKYKSKNIVNITADCPILDYKILKKNIVDFKKKKFDCISNSFVRSYPDGMDFTIFNYNTLKKTYKLAKKQKHKEHTRLFIFENPKIFRTKHVVAKKNFWPELGLTLDERNDFKLIKKIIIFFFKKNNFYFSCSNIIELLRKKKNWVKINENVLRKGYDKNTLRKNNDN